MKPRVLIENKSFYNRGGDCMVAINEESMLRRHGYPTAVFTMDYPENKLPAIPHALATRREFNGSAQAQVKAAARTLGFGDISRSFRKILNDFRPDIVHFHNIHSYLSPRIVELAKEYGARTLWTMHDYKLLCPSYSFLRDGKICELCMSDRKSVLRERCHKHSLPASLVAYLEARKWNIGRLRQSTDRFITPRPFLAPKLAEGGIESDKTAVICNCIDKAKSDIFISHAPDKPRSGAVYAGRLSEEKGVRLIVEAFEHLPIPLDIYGTGPLEEDLRRLASGNSNIRFHGRVEAAAIAEALGKASFSVIPSEWYENNPLGVIESLCAGTPVVGAGIGGIPELIEPENGIIFPFGDAAALGKAVAEALERKWDNAGIAAKALGQFSEDTHFRKLSALMQEIMQE